VQPGIDVLGLELKTFGIMFALAFVVSGLIVGRGLREAGKPTDWAYEMVFAALVGGLVGARVYWLIQNAGDLEGAVVSNIFSAAAWSGTAARWAVRSASCRGPRGAACSACACSTSALPRWHSAMPSGG
jgi:phosphatidylglycerol:prolipoprotein diacylglycerol transferase